MASTAVAPRVAPTAASARPGVTRWHALPEMRWAAIALGLFLLGLLAQTLGAAEVLAWACYLACYAAGGWEPALTGLRALRQKTLDVDLLMVVAAVGAAAIGQVLDGALLIVIFATSGALEALATARTEDSVRGLLELAPETAVKIGEAGDEVCVPTSALAVGEEILVRPGERIGADGVVVSGASDVDQATVTGESVPAQKAMGDEVFAGTLNGTGVLRVRVMRRAEDSVVARIAVLVQEASRTKATTQLFVEKIEQRYSVGMVLATLALFGIPLALGVSFEDALLRAMTFMIVASPCAVVLSSMPPLLAAVANAGRHGVLVKSAVVMERLGTTSLLAFDKTGTLTEGAPVLTDVHPLRHLSETEILRLAASLEHASEHPLARAVTTAARERGSGTVAVQDFTAQPGVGVAGTVAGRRVTIAAAGGAAGPVAAQLQAEGRTVVVVSVDGEPCGLLGFTDTLREDAPAAVRAVAVLTGRSPLLLTGDNAATAAQVARETGITQLQSGLLPDEKLSRIRSLQESGEQVTFVGDGINDAPALAAAHTGIAMGAGSDLTLQTADAVVVRADLSSVAAVISLSRRARRVVIANLTIAAMFITVLVLWDLFGHLPLPLGVAGHEGSTILVGLNGLRLLRRRRGPRPAGPPRALGARRAADPPAVPGRGSRNSSLRHEAIPGGDLLVCPLPDQPAPEWKP